MIRGSSFVRSGYLRRQSGTLNRSALNIDDWTTTSLSDPEKALEHYTGTVVKVANNDLRSGGSSLRCLAI